MKKIIFIILFVINVTSLAVYARESMPYTGQAMDSLNRAYNKVGKFVPPATSNKKVFAKAFVDYYKRLFDFAGYDFEKTIVKLLKDSESSEFQNNTVTITLSGLIDPFVYFIDDLKDWQIKPESILKKATVKSLANVLEQKRRQAINDHFQQEENERRKNESEKLEDLYQKASQSGFIVHESDVQNVPADVNSFLIIREEQKIVIDGAEEIWSLVWIGRPKPICTSGVDITGDDENFYTQHCECSGFENGEEGNLVLVRKRNDVEEEHLFLPSRLRRWDLNSNDDTSKPNILKELKSRPLAKVMNFADYDHDGQATEFIFHSSNTDGSCGTHEGIVIGVSKDNPRLHEFSSVANPSSPLILRIEHWEQLKSSIKPIQVIVTGYGNHGYENQDECRLSAKDGKIYATMLTYECSSKSKRGKIVDKCERSKVVRKYDF